MSNNCEQKEELERRMDRIIEWVKTCDNKATILLTIDSLMLTILLTSDFVLGGMQRILISIFDSNKTAFSLAGAVALLFFALSIAFSIISIYHCLLAIKAKTNGNKHKLTDNDVYSLIHFDGIDRCKTYKEFSEALNTSVNNEELLEDIKIQIFINAKRCTEKYSHYNKGIKWIMVCIPFMVMSVICLLLFLI